MIRYEGFATLTSEDLRTVDAGTIVQASRIIAGVAVPVGEIELTAPSGPRTHPYYPEGLGPSYDAPRQGRTDPIPNPVRYICYKNAVKQTETGSWESALGFFDTHNTPEPQD